MTKDNRIGKKTPGRAWMKQNLEAQGWETLGFSQFQITRFVFPALPQRRCCPRGTGVCLCLHSPEAHKWISEKELGITFENFCLETKGEFMLCQGHDPACSLVFLKHVRVQAWTLPPQRKGDDETYQPSTSTSVSDKRGVWQRQPSLSASSPIHS